jgi:actin-related protein 10
MAFLENSIERPAVVLDIGHAYTKCGFAGDHGPKYIIKSEIYKNGQNINVFKYKNEDDLKENLMEFIYRIYYKILNINSRDRKLVIVESVLNQTNVRKILTDILFKNFQVISLFFIPSHLAALYSLGINTALVIDCGFEDIQIMPISEYYLM